MLRLFDYVLSDDAYKARLMLALLGLTYEAVAVDVYPGGAGPVPRLEDGELSLEDPQLILVHLARSYDPGGTWLPVEPGIATWLAFARNGMGAISRARRIAMLGEEGDFDAERAAGYAALRRLDDHVTDRSLEGAHWVLGRTASIADIALFPGVALCNDARLGLEDFPALNLWQRRLRSLPRFIGMPGIPDYF